MPKSLLSKNQLIEQEDAVGMYLSALLCDQRQEKSDNECEISLELTPQENVFDTQSESLINIDKKITLTDETSQAQTERHIPDYLSNGFQSLSFTVSNMKLCVPLQQLNGIIEWNGEITKLPGQAGWCVGIMRTRGRNMSVIDLYKVLHTTFDDFTTGDRLTKNSVQYVLLIGNGEWGLACDSVNNISTLYKDDIAWRSSGTRELIMGTVVEHMNLILNIEEIVRRLENSALVY